MKTIFEPFRVKMVEPIKMTTSEQRAVILKEAGHNLFLVHSNDVIIDLLTDSGTGAMSSNQWAGVMTGDESYAGSPTFYRFEKTVQELTGYKHIIPTHQGRAAEKILFNLLPHSGKITISNSHFDTTRANIEFVGNKAIDIPCKEATDPSLEAPFKGNMDVDALQKLLKDHPSSDIAAVIMTITNNSRGAQPASLENIRQVSKLCRSAKVPFFIDACRFAENAYLIKTREPGQKDRTTREIAEDIFRLADGATMSGKKDGMANMGGFLALNDDQWAEKAKQLLILMEGFPTYGGLSGRDLEAFTIGILEALDEDYLKYRIRSIEYTVEKLKSAGVPMVLPAGGHAVYLDAAAFLSHIPKEQFPGVSLAGALYITGGIRTSEIGSLMFGKKDHVHSGPELVRLAFPRRSYTQSHTDYVCEVVIEVFKNRKSLKGLKLNYQGPFLRHFTARLVPV